MTYTPYVFNDFSGGLNLKAKADLVGANECIDCLNVVFTDGTIRQRPGYEELTSSDVTNNITSLHGSYLAAGTRILAGCGTRLEAIIPSTGAVDASLTGLTGPSGAYFWGFCDYGTATTNYTFTGSGYDVLKTWSGSAWASVSSSPKGSCLAVTPSSNRLVATRFGTTDGGPDASANSSSPSHVYFSDPGDPTSWPTTNYVQLDPNDGEQITAAVTWREYVFIFKETRFYVFTEESTDADGNPVFNYRKIDVGIGCAGPRAVATDENGVYFVDRTGVYLTTGEAPVKLSEAVDPLFYGEDTDYVADLDFDLISTPYHMNAVLWQDLLIISNYNTGATAVTTLVYDTKDGWWSRWQPLLSPGCWATYRIRGGPDLLIMGTVATSNQKKVFEYTPSVATDDSAGGGASIVSHWQSGFTDLGIAQNKRIRQVKVWGSGVVRIKTFFDFDTSTTPTVTDFDFTAISGPAVNVGLHRTSVRGTTFGFRLDDLNGAWSVHRIEPQISSPRQVTTTQTEKS